MTETRRLAVVAVAVVVALGFGVPVVSGAEVTSVAADPVSTVGHVCDQFGWHNDWGAHQHGDHWRDHPHDGATDHHDPHGPQHPDDSHHGPDDSHHGPDGSQTAPGPHHGPDGHGHGR
jgi:hypothetical protein